LYIAYQGGLIVFSKRIAPPDKKKNEPIKILMGGDDAYD
jgi:hypothetical protein